jgi:hypothetical protein
MGSVDLMEKRRFKRRPSKLARLECAGFASDGLRPALRAFL